MGRITILLTLHRIYYRRIGYGISIAFTIRSVDRALFAYLISLFSRLILWSETILRRNAYVNPVIERK